MPKMYLTSPNITREKHFWGYYITWSDPVKHTTLLEYIKQYMLRFLQGWRDESWVIWAVVNHANYFEFKILSWEELNISSRYYLTSISRNSAKGNFHSIVSWWLPDIDVELVNRCHVFESECLSTWLPQVLHCKDSLLRSLKLSPGVIRPRSLPYNRATIRSLSR